MTTFDITKVFPEDSCWGTFLCILLFVLLVVVTKSQRDAIKSRCFLTWFFCAVFVEFAFWGGDYYHYAEIMVEMSGSRFDYMAALNQNHMETPYWVLAHFCRYNYLIFRFIVWCGNLMLLYALCHHIKIKSSHFLYYFVPIALLTFSGSRQCLSETVALWGWFIFVKRWQEKGFSLVALFIGGLFILFSTFLHKSSLFFVAILIISFINVDMRKIRILAISLPIMVAVIGAVIVPYLLGADISEDGMINYRSAQSYMDKAVVSYGISTWILLILTYLGYCFGAFFICRSVKRGEYEKWPLLIKKTANVALYTFAFSIPFVFLPSTFSMFYRFIVYMLLPIVLLLAMLRQKGFHYRMSYSLVVLYFVISLYSLGLNFLGKLL